ncbi:hypothetical protein LCGC14_2736800 [marine sediment metagenome]|uniref:Uncharacterized protein n=1 Tax=marine sediment metagenome TaxID=412755 RepID=A0A0F8Z5M5_9ZZZZ
MFLGLTNLLGRHEGKSSFGISVSLVSGCPSRNAPSQPRLHHYLTTWPSAVPHLFVLHHFFMILPRHPKVPLTLSPISCDKGPNTLSLSYLAVVTPLRDKARRCLGIA